MEVPLRRTFDWFIDVFLHRSLSNTHILGNWIRFILLKIVKLVELVIKELEPINILDH